MFLKKGVGEGLLLEGDISREKLAGIFGYPLQEVNGVLDGEMEAGEELTLMFLSAFGSEIMDEAIDWERTE